MTIVDYLGWTATAVFVSSYFYSRATALRRTQMAGSILWILYGVVMHAAPVVVANLLVFGAAAWTGRRSADNSADTLTSVAGLPPVRG
jgi:hypothetical protein